MKDLFTINNYILCYKQYKFILETPIKLIKYPIYIIGWCYLINLTSLLQG